MHPQQHVYPNKIIDVYLQKDHLKILSSLTIAYHPILIVFEIQKRAKRKAQQDKNTLKILKPRIKWGTEIQTATEFRLKLVAEITTVTESGHYTENTRPKNEVSCEN